MHNKWNIFINILIWLWFHFLELFSALIRSWYKRDVWKWGRQLCNMGPRMDLNWRSFSTCSASSLVSHRDMPYYCNFRLIAKPSFLICRTKFAHLQKVNLNIFCGGCDNISTMCFFLDAHRWCDTRSCQSFHSIPLITGAVIDWEIQQHVSEVHFFIKE